MKNAKVDGARLLGRTTTCVTLAGRVATLTASTLLAVFLGHAAFAEKMDAEIHSVVIAKLEQALKETRETENVSLKPTRARLADLYAERARLRAMAEAEKNCQECTGAIDDRKRALQMYDLVLKETSKSERGPLMLQMAQMHELNNEAKAAEALYEKIVSDGQAQHGKGIVAEGYIGRAEARFGRGDVDHAQKDFESALKLVGATRQGPILHRIAWCYLNKGEQVQAVRTMVHILETPELLNHESSDGIVFDASFQEDVTRDLATFFARGEVTHREIALLESLSSERSKKDIMKHFAGECERLGQKKAAIEAWATYAKYEDKNSDHLEAMIRVAQIRFELGEKKEALLGIQQSVAFWNQKGCDDKDECVVLQERLRAFVIDWNKIEKKQPSSMVVDAYLAYLSHFDSDAEMTEWAAEAARSQKRYAQAATLFHRSSVLASTSKVKGAQTILENGVVGEVEMAELSKDNATREASYDHYIALNPNGAIIFKIRYQRAHVAYERNDMREASARFHEFAIAKECAGSKNLLCVQAADLDLDAIASLKQNDVLQARANEYAAKFPARRVEYLKISRTAVLKQVETEEPEQAMLKLAEADLSAATTEERIRIFKTRLSLAERGHNVAETRRSAQMLLASKGISESDKELALAKIEWAAEMDLDFKAAFAIARKMKFAQLRPEDRAMKLALLAELSGSDSRSFEEQFLKLSHDASQKAMIRARFVRDARNPRAEFAKQESYLKSYPALYASLALEIYSKTGDAAFAGRALKVRGVARDAAGRTLAEQIFMKSFAQFEHEIAQHHLSSGSDALVKRSLADRLKLLRRGEDEANRAIAMHDWALQLMTLTTLSRENKRLYSDIVALPVPRKLKGKDRLTYVRLVENSARGYLGRSQDIDHKLQQLWADRNSEMTLIGDYTAARPEFRAMIGIQIRQLATLAPATQQRELNDSLKSSSPTPSEQQISQARSEAKERPFHSQTLLKLRQLEDQRGRETMVAYLDARILKLKTGERQ